MIGLVAWRGQQLTIRGALCGCRFGVGEDEELSVPASVSLARLFRAAGLAPPVEVDSPPPQPTRALACHAQAGRVDLLADMPSPARRAGFARMPCAVHSVPT